MDLFLQFYKTHYNFAALTAIVLIAAFWLLNRGNTKWFTILFVGILIYNGLLYRQVHSNPQWVEQIEGRVQQVDLVDIIWGASDASSLKNASESRDKQQ